MNKVRVIKLLIYALLMVGWTLPTHAALPIRLESVSIDVHDQAALERGAKFFAGHCLACHGLQYLAHDPIANAAGITAQTMPGTARKQAVMIPPPDLSLEVRVRGAAWLYTYLHSFYQDNSQPLGSNNLLLNSVNMPNPFAGLQGVQVLTVDKKQLLTNGLSPKPFWFNVLKLEKQGALTSEQFNQTITDVVTFLAYASDPSQVKRERLGYWVLGFLLLFTALTYLLWRAYWKKIRKLKSLS